jgi:hypothetical protein
MHQVELIEYYSPPGAEVKGAAEQVRGRVPQIRQLAEQVEKDHKPALDAVAGDLEASMADAPRGAITNANDVMRAAEYAAGCLELFSQAIDQHNFYKQSRPRSVSTLNAEYNAALSDSFGVDFQDPGPHATQEQKDKASENFSNAFQSARGAKEAELRQEAAELDGWLDGEADGISRMLDRGPNEADVQALYRAGALAPYAAIVFPTMGLARIPLPEAAQRELLQYLIDNPDVLIDLPPELAAVVAALPTAIRTDVYVEQRMEQLRRRGLLSGPNPGGYYEQWIRNTVTNNVSLETVAAIAHDHDIRPDDFHVLNGLREIKDGEGKSFFLLDKDISGDDARRAVLMTYILNAGTGYPAGHDFAPTPYGSDEVQRIMDRQNENRWSYNQDVGFVHGNGGRLVATPNGMLMGAGGNELQDLYSNGGGTAWGDIFVINEDDLDNPDQRLQAIIESGYAPDGTPANGNNPYGLDLDRLLHHEERHSQQWAREGYGWFITQYGWESLGGDCLNKFEEDAGFSDGGYGDCATNPPTPTPSPGPSPTPPR